MWGVNWAEGSRFRAVLAQYYSSLCFIKTFLEKKTKNCPDCRLNWNARKQVETGPQIILGQRHSGNPEAPRCGTLAERCTQLCLFARKMFKTNFNNPPGEQYRTADDEEKKKNWPSQNAELRNKGDHQSPICDFRPKICDMRLRLRSLQMLNFALAACSFNMLMLELKQIVNANYLYKTKILVKGQYLAVPGNVVTVV